MLPPAPIPASSTSAAARAPTPTAASHPTALSRPSPRARPCSATARPTGFCSSAATSSSRSTGFSTSPAARRRSRILISAYGSGERPLLNTRSDNAFTTNVTAVNHVAIVGLRFNQQHERPQVPRLHQHLGRIRLLWGRTGERPAHRGLLLRALRHQPAVPGHAGARDQPRRATAA